MSLALQRFLVLLAALAVLASGCTGSSGGDIASETTDPTAEETATVEPTAEPTPTVVPLTEEQVWAAALETFEADPQPTDLIAYDLIEVRSRGTTGVTEVVVCGWRESTVFNKVYVVAYRVNQADDASPTVTFESANTISEDCLNTGMVGSAIEATRLHDEYWSAVLENPSSADMDTASTIFLPELLQDNAERVDALARDGLAYRSTDYDAMLPDSSVTELLGRQYETAGFEIFEIIACRELPEDYGLYRADVLIDDFRGTDQTGDQATIQYQMTRLDNQWFMVGISGRLWTDCLSFDDGWLSAVNRLLPEPAPWIPLSP